MDSQVRANIDARRNLLEGFRESADDSMKAQIDAFIRKIEDLGEDCASAADFEERFNGGPLLAEFGALYGGLCNAQATAPSGTFKQAAAAYVGLGGKDIAQAVAVDAVERANVEAQQALLDGSRDGFLQAESDFLDTDAGKVAGGVRQAVDVAGMFGRLKKKRK